MLYLRMSFSIVDVVRVWWIPKILMLLILVLLERLLGPASASTTMSESVERFIIIRRADRASCHPHHYLATLYNLLMVLLVLL